MLPAKLNGPTIFRIVCFLEVALWLQWGLPGNARSDHPSPGKESLSFAKRYGDYWIRVNISPKHPKVEEDVELTAFVYNQTKSKHYEDRVIVRAWSDVNPDFAWVSKAERYQPGGFRTQTRFRVRGSHRIQVRLLDAPGGALSSDAFRFRVVGSGMGPLAWFAIGAGILGMIALAFALIWMRRFRRGSPASNDA